MSTETITTSRGQEEEKGEEADDPSKTMENLTAAEICRKEKRKMLKKLKRKQIRKEIAIKERAEEELRLEDPEEQRKLMLKEQEEAEMIERQRKDFEERERLWMERVAQKAQEEEEARRKIIEEQKEDEVHQKQIENENDTNGDDNAWEYVEEGPVEIIWQGNEIIVKKKTVRVAKRNSKEQACVEDANRPTSNPLPPQSEAFSSYKNTSISSRQVFESVSSQTPNFGTEQDKANCPFHIKTGACRFGSRCSRVHFYPDKSCTLLIKNMYSGPGLAWEQDEGLEKFSSRFGGDSKFWILLELVCTLRSWCFSVASNYFKSIEIADEEVERCYEEFYADVHDEFAKFGEIVNFKVCRNGSFHLRGNVYVHYKSLESAMDAYHSTNGRYYACKQITCEYVGVTRWKVAICGEYMKSRFKTCSRGTACNFIHCFRNPCGDYEWADSDKPPPRYWVKRMAAIFGPSDEVGHDKQLGSKTPDQHRNPRKKTTPKSERYHSRRSRSRDIDYRSNSSDEDNSDENRGLSHRRSRRHKQNTGSRYMKSPSDDHASREYYAEDKERPDKYSRAHSTYSSKWEDRPYNHDNAEKKYANNVSEHAEGKDRVHTDDYPRKYHDRVESKDYSSRQDHKTGREKADVDKHVKSEECYNSQHVEKKYANNASEHAEVKDRVQADDSSRKYHDRVESRDHSSRHRKTGMKKKADLDENVKSEECYNSHHLEKKYANYASEHAEEKNWVQIDDSSRKYNDRVEGRDHSSGQDRQTGIEKKADLDEHMKSGECSNSRHVEKEYTNNVSEDVEEKVRLRNDDSPRKYCDRLESRDHSSRQDHKSRMEKAADLDSRKDRKTRMADKSDLDEHVKSVELYNSEDVEKKYANKAAEHAEEIDRVRTDDSPRKYSDKVESGDHSSRQDRKTSRREKKADLDVHVKSEECYNSGDSDSRPSSEHHRRKHRSRPSRRVQSKNLEVEGGSSSEDQHSEGNLKDYHKKHRSRGRKQHRRHYKETSSSGESGEESSLERDDSRHNSETRISSRSRKEQDSHRRRKHYTKKKDKNTDEDKKSKRKRTSRKRSRSRSPVQSSSKAKRATPSDS